MKKTKFRVWFTNGEYPAQPVSISAFNKSQGVILAQAARINAGLDYTVSTIDTLD